MTVSLLPVSAGVPISINAQRIPPNLAQRIERHCSFPCAWRTVKSSPLPYLRGDWTHVPHLLEACANPAHICTGTDCRANAP